ncbi:unnamed protein product [Closterium sp. NIES-54]
MTTLWVLLHVAAQHDYELNFLDFSTAFLQGSLHEEIWWRRPPGFTESFPAGTKTTLAALGFAPATADPSLFLRTDTSLPPFYVLVYVDDLVFATADTEQWERKEEEGKGITHTHHPHTRHLHTLPPTAARKAGRRRGGGGGGGGGEEAAPRPQSGGAQGRAGAAAPRAGA